jgi:hypothetical protein
MAPTLFRLQCSMGRLAVLREAWKGDSGWQSRTVGDASRRCDYGLGRKTNARKRNDMKRFALVSVAALMLAATLYAPRAQALVDPVESVTLGPGGVLIVTGTVHCPEVGELPGVALQLEVIQPKGNQPANSTNLFRSGPCDFWEPRSYEFHLFASKPFKKGRATLITGYAECSHILFGPCESSQTVEEIRLR